MAGDAEVIAGTLAVCFALSALRSHWLARPSRRARGLARRRGGYVKLAASPSANQGMVARVRTFTGCSTDGPLLAAPDGQARRAALSKRIAPTVSGSGTAGTRGLPPKAAA